eukprot:TRINITY_DN2212_c0_g1_i2.p1 TRINITY_DN2212_c0_g1~~TRINITY_DN2212_c0_g1_i2.p1  ORF type:complete len:188 (-),score=51.49 TRINITY_DN2212_c0_g1_i2:69-632(-)
MVVEVKYCGVCGLPVEYCEFGPSPPKCKEWALETLPREFIPKEYLVDEVEKKVEGLSIGDGKAGPSSSSSTTTTSSSEEPVKILPGGKVKKKDPLVVQICTSARNKRKFVTTVSGLEKFGIKLPDAAKLFGKKFACGASVVKDPTEKEEIDIQGDVADDLYDFIIEKYGDIIPEDSIQLIEEKKKKK